MSDLKTYTKTEREDTLISLYKANFPVVAKFVSRRGGSFEQAKDIFHDAILILYEKAENSPRSINSTQTAYLIGVAKHLWYRRYSDEKRQVPYDSIGEHLVRDLPDEQIASERLLSLLAGVGKKCVEMLKSFYYEKSTMTEIADTYGFRSVRSV